MATFATKADQRTSRRFALKLPVSIRCNNGHVEEVEAETRDVSAQGVFFYSGSLLSEGTKVEFTLTLPPEITLTESIRVRCRGRVVRIKQEPPRVGVAAIIEQYDFVPDTADA
ncbi:MAG TPA: PilZ domain-containing protein [Terriglobales bacterium]|nr:PilZ domain-containing protein [Terriglobales bacterium]